MSLGKTARRIPALDGVRAVALLAVVAFHALGRPAGGFLGVDLFFLLSGYLITASLLAEREASGTISLAHFWRRRAQRLLPALYILLACAAVYVRFVASAREMGTLRADALATLAYVQNWRQASARTSYWTIFERPSLLDHAWSLSIEEQFYVGWPLLVVWLSKKTNGTRLLGIVAFSLAALSIGAMVFFYDPASTARAYYGTDTRAAALLFGAALATVPPRALPSWVGVIAALALALAWWKLDGHSRWLYPVGFVFDEAASALLVFFLVRRTDAKNIVARVFSWTPLRWLGVVSYGAYLWHWPVQIVLSSRLPNGAWVAAASFGSTLVIAALSYRFVERPILHARLSVRAVAFGAVSFAAVLVMLLWWATTPRHRLDERRRLELHPPPARPFRVLLVGDSTANALGWALRASGGSSVEIDSIGQNGCDLWEDNCNSDTWADRTITFRPDATALFLGGAAMYDPMAPDPFWSEPCGGPWDTTFRRRLAMRLPALFAHGVTVWLATIPYGTGPKFGGEVPHRGIDCLNESIRAVAASFPTTKILELARILCPTGTCAPNESGALVRPDGIHFVVEGSRPFAQRILDDLRGAQ